MGIVVANGGPTARLGRQKGGAVQQADAADEAGASDGASQLIRGVRRTFGEGIRRPASLVALSLITLSCATTTHYARRPEAERSAQVFVTSIRLGMTLEAVVRALVECRLPYQYASLSSAAPNGDTVRIILHAGEPLATIGRTRVFASGFASLEVYRRAEAHLASYGFERQGPLLTAVEARQKELLAQPRFVLAFDAKVEGGCGESRLPLTFDAAGHLSNIGQVEEDACDS